MLPSSHTVTLRYPISFSKFAPFSGGGEFGPSSNTWFLGRTWPDPPSQTASRLSWLFSTISVCWDGVIDWPIEWTWDLTKRIAIYVTWPNNNNNKLKTRSRYARFWLECDSGGRAGLWPGPRIMARTACGLGQATGPHCAWTNHMLVIWTDNQIVWLL